MQAEKKMIFLFVILYFSMVLSVLEAAPIVSKSGPPETQWINYFPLILAGR